MEPSLAHRGCSFGDAAFACIFSSGLSSAGLTTGFLTTLIFWVNRAKCSERVLKHFDNHLICSNHLPNCSNCNPNRSHGLPNCSNRQRSCTYLSRTCTFHQRNCSKPGRSCTHLSRTCAYEQPNCSKPGRSFTHLSLTCAYEQRNCNNGQQNASMLNHGSARMLQNNFREKRDGSGGPRDALPGLRGCSDGKPMLFAGSENRCSEPDGGGGDQPDDKFVALSRFFKKRGAAKGISFFCKHSTRPLIGQQLWERRIIHIFAPRINNISFLITFP